MKKFLKILLWLVVIVIVIITFVFLYKNSQPKETSFETITPKVIDIERTTVLTGKIEPRDEIEIKPQIQGQITEILVEAGQMVQSGQVIARIRIIPDAAQVSSAEARVQQASQSLSNAKSIYDLNASLYDKRLLSREEYENYKNQYLLAVKELDAAKDALNVVRSGVSKYNASEASTEVRATITGLVLDVPVKVGSTVVNSNNFNDGTTIATIADMSNLIFKGNVDETEVGSLRVGMPMTIEIGALPDVHPTATIEYLSPKGTESNGANTFELKAAIDIPAGVEMRSGYSANATVTLSGAKGVLTVPESAVEFTGDSTFVYVEKPAKGKEAPTYTRTAVKTGLSDGINVQIISGIDKDARLRGNAVEQTAKTKDNHPPHP